jgi:hypothetical protein
MDDHEWDERGILTEVDWWECTSPEAMERFMRYRVSPRKHRLLGVACCRSVSGLLIRPENLNAVEVAERYADGLAAESELIAAWGQDPAFERWAGEPPLSEFIDTPQTYPAASAGHRAASQYPMEAAGQARAAYAYAACGEVSGDGPDLWDSPSYQEAERSERLRQCALVREILGNPFRPVAFDPTWRTPQAVAVARTAYDERRWEDLPLLADALEEAGCTDAAILSHCRGPGPHVRGCWVVDLILGKE